MKNVERYSVKNEQLMGDALETYFLLYGDGYESESFLGSHI
jgi:hypothetical protein